MQFSTSQVLQTFHRPKVQLLILKLIKCYILYKFSRLVLLKTKISVNLFYCNSYIIKLHIKYKQKYLFRINC